MKLTADACRQAVLTHFGEEVANRLRLPADLDDVDFAGHLVAALGVQGDLSLKRLGVSLVTPEGDALFIKSEEIDAHPVMQMWMRDDLGDALAHLVLTGSRRFSFSPDGSGSPNVRLVMIGPDRKLVATLEGTIATPQGSVRAIVHFGDAIGDAAFSHGVTIAGWALFQVGRDARRLSSKADTPRELSDGRVLH